MAPLAVLVLLGVLGVGTAPPSGASGPDCGGVALAKPGGGRWRCTFDDEFDGTSLDTSKWLPQETANSNYHSGLECFVNTPDNISVANGYLNLTVRKEAKPFVCGGLVPYTTSYTSGMVTTYGRFNQTYGRFEVRAKLPRSTVQGLQESFWLYPQNLTYGRWPSSGEIDFAEAYSSMPGKVTPTVHYAGSKSDADASPAPCAVGDLSQPHTYAVEWTTTTLTVTYDGKVCMVDQWNPAPPQQRPEPFDQPFMVSLTQALGVDANMAVPGVTALPATTQIDYVRVWS